MVYPKFNKFLPFLSVFLMTLFSLVTALKADEKNSPPKVVVTIKPLHSLVSSVMKGVGEPMLLLKGASSPHHFQLKPSDAVAIKRADLIVRVGPKLETPMNKVLKSLSSSNSVLNVVDLDGLTFYQMRSKHHHDHGGAHGDHDGHDDHKKHAKHDDHDHHDHKKKHAKHDHDEDHHDHKKHAKHDDHDHHDHKKKHAKHDHDEDHHDHKKHAKHDDHDHDKHGHDEHKEDANFEKDQHMWLHTGNAKTVALALAKKLAKLDPKNSKTYQANAAALSAKLDKLSAEITALMKPLDDRSYMVFHDAYQYLTAPYDLHFAGAITLNPATPPSAKHLKELIKTLKKEKVICIFSEVQYNPKLVKALSEGHNVKTSVIDPIGAKVKAGPDAYYTMMKNLSTEINACLKP